MKVSNKNNNKLDEINIDLIPLEQKLILDLHGLTIDETRILLDQEFEIIKKDIVNIKIIMVLLHGYSKGEVLKKYIREEYKHEMIKVKHWHHNPGISYYIIKDNK